MKAVLQNIKTGQVSIEDIPAPILKSGNVLVQNIFSLVSAGTERAVLEFSNANYLQKARMRPDLFRKVLNKAKNDGLWNTYKVVSELIEQKIQLGYSTAGVVIGVGSDVQDIQVGQRVACAGLFAATHSEAVSVPRNLVVQIPENVDLEDACYVTLGAIALQGVRLADLALGEHVVVYGLGLVGMIAAQLALAAGCHVIGVDIDPSKLDIANQFGCECYLIDADLDAKILAATGGYGADKILLCAATKSNEPIERLPNITRQKGLVVVIGDVSMDVPRRAYYDKEIDLKISRSYGPGRYDLSYEEGGLDYPYAYVRWTENRNMQAVIDLLARKRLDFKLLTTHCFDVSDALKAYEIIEGKVKERFLGITIKYGDESVTKMFPSTIPFQAQNQAPTKTLQAVNFGVIGAGNFGKAFLLPAFSRQKDVRFVGISTASGVSAVSMAKKYNMNVVSSNPDELIEDERINALLVSTRHDSHARYVKKAIEKDKAIFVEKPLVITMQELDDVKNLHDAKVAQGKMPFVMVGFNRRFSPLAVSLREVFAKTGEPVSMIYRVNAGFVPKTEWVHDALIGGGRIVGEACHFIDFLTYVCGALPVAISGSAVRKGQAAVPDVVTLSLEFANGSIGSVHYYANGNPGMAKERIEVFGAGVSAELENFRKLKVHGAKALGKTSYFNQVKGFDEEAAVFVSALKAGHGSPISFAEIYATTKATLLAEQAITSGTRLAIQDGDCDGSK